MLIALFLCRSNRQIHTVMVAGATILLLASALLAILYIDASGQQSELMLFGADHQWYPSLNIRYATGVDGISVLMIALSSIIVFTGVFSSWGMPREYFMWFCLLSIGVFGFFISIDLFLIFLFYEIALIPMYLLIGVWGTGRKEYSAMKLTLMLMAGSAFLLIGILGIYYSSGQTSMNLHQLAAQNNIPIQQQYWIFPAVFVGFGVLGAMFPFHSWSPDGHASAPTAVSMLHAGVLMKLGGYGCFRVAIYLMPQAAHELSWIFLILTGAGVIYGAFGAVVQTDLKYINAYSSVSHCGLVLFAILMLNSAAMTGAVLQMLSHGLMTALFFALIGLIYGRTHTRDIREMGGLMRVMPFASVAYVIAGLASLGLPGLSGFVAEMMVFVGSFQHGDLFHRILTVLAACSIVITAVYILRTVGKILYGPIHDQRHLSLPDARWYERISAIGLIIFIVALGIFPYGVAELISQAIQPVIGR